MMPTYEQIHDRNYGIYSKSEQDKIKSSKIAVIGQGCVGELESIVLAKIGVGELTISDFDEYEPANMNRNPLARISVLGRKKADVVDEFITDAEPYLKINRIGKVEEENVLKLLSGHDIILQAVDDMPTRVIVHRASKELGISCVTVSGAPPYRSIVSTFMPEGIDYEFAFGLPTKGNWFNNKQSRKEFAKTMRNNRAKYYAKTGDDPEWAE